MHKAKELLMKDIEKVIDKIEKQEDFEGGLSQVRMLKDELELWDLLCKFEGHSKYKNMEAINSHLGPSQTPSFGNNATY